MKKKRKKEKKKETDPMFVEELSRCVVVVYHMRVLKYFDSGGTEIIWVQNL